MKANHKPLVFGIAILGTIDALGIAAMVVEPTIVDAVIPALMLVQLFGAITIALACLVMGTIFNGDDSSGEDGVRYLKKWALQIFRILFGFLIVYKILRAMFTIGTTGWSWRTAIMLLGTIVVIDVLVQRYRTVRKRLASETSQLPLAENEPKDKQEGISQRTDRSPG